MFCARFAANANHEQILRSNGLGVPSGQTTPIVDCVMALYFNLTHEIQFIECSTTPNLAWMKYESTATTKLSHAAYLADINVRQEVKKLRLLHCAAGRCFFAPVVIPQIILETTGVSDRGSGGGHILQQKLTT